MSVALAVVISLAIGIVAGFLGGWYVFKKRKLD